MRDITVRKIELAAGRHEVGAKRWGLRTALRELRTALRELRAALTWRHARAAPPYGTRS